MAGGFPEARLTFQSEPLIQGEPHHVTCGRASLGEDGHTEPSRVQMEGPLGEAFPAGLCNSPRDNTASHPDKDTVAGPQGAPSCRTRHGYSYTSPAGF